MKLQRRLYQSPVPIKSQRGYQQALGVIAFTVILTLYGSLIVAPFVIASVTSVTLLEALQHTVVAIGLSHAVLLAVLFR